MVPSPLFLERLEKVKKTVHSENDTVTTCYMGSATPAAHMKVSMAKFANDPDVNINTTLKYINEINSIAPIDCLNMGAGGMKINVILTGMWLSKIKMPGKELPEESLWQVDEKKVLLEEDYDLVINEGLNALKGKILPQVIEMSELQEFQEYMQKNAQKNALLVIENDYPSVNAAASSPPFEMLCGARSMSQFFMDCYKMPDKIEAAINAMLPDIIESMVQTVKQAQGMGTWVGGWRGASAMVSPKIWDKLVWPSMYQMGMACIENDITPTFHLDQNWDRDIERFLELPAKKCIINTDGMTDLRNLRKKLGTHCAIMGDAPPQLLATGSP
ncbi:MAG TPA: methyltransferase, partial [Eubacteriaceae bacterium]|nr:methyltransferase [Eubacteriaceae bacterium]